MPLVCHSEQVDSSLLSLIFVFLDKLIYFHSVCQRTWSYGSVVLLLGHVLVGSVLVVSSELEEVYSFYVDSNLVHELQGFDLALNHLELVLIAPKLGLAVLESGFVEQVFRVVNQGKRGKATLTTSEGMNQCLFLNLVLHLYLNVGPKHRFSSQKDVLKSDDFSKVRVVCVL